MGPSWLWPILVSLEGTCPIVGGWRAWRRWREVEPSQSHSAERSPTPRNLLQLYQVLWLQALGGRAREGETAAGIHGNACLLHHKMAERRDMTEKKNSTHFAWPSETSASIKQYIKIQFLLQKNLFHFYYTEKFVKHVRGNNAVNRMHIYLLQAKEWQMKDSLYVAQYE